MGTTAEKLAYLEATKADIRAALVEKGLDVPESMPFRQYGDLIRTMISAPEKKALNDMTWDEISEVSKMGLAKSYFAVGDTKSVTLSGTVGNLAINQTLAVFILGIDHNIDFQDQGITFGCFKTAVSGGKNICLVDDRYDTQVSNLSDETQRAFTYNISRDTNYGWKRAKIRSQTLGSSQASDFDATPDATANPKEYTLMSTFPEELRSVMKPMHICTDNNGQGDETHMDLSFTVDYLPLLSSREITGGSEPNTSANTYIKQYDYFKNGNSKTKYKHNSISTLAKYWTRSPSNSDDYATYVTTSGTTGSSYANYSYGLAPMFLI